MKMSIGVLRNKISITLAVLSILITVAGFVLSGQGGVAYASGLQRHIPGPGGPSPCPANSTGYTGNLDSWNCGGIYYDTGLHGVWMRKGMTGTSGFGVAHFGEHNLNALTVEHVIDIANLPTQQAGTRWRYGVQYADTILGGISQYVIVIEERGKPYPAGVTDGGEQGIITAYCEGRGHAFEQTCPDWVNDTLTWDNFEPLP